MEFLPAFWAVVLAVSILIYVVLDGFDLGVGILFGTTGNQDHRRMMMGSIAPVWDGNETWLIVVGTILFAAFPLVYAIIAPAFYLPLLLLLVGLILRGVAFEFRYKTVRMRPFWDFGFFFGSLLAAFVQGAAVGALVEGLPIANGAFAGGPFEWLQPFPVLCGIGLIIGYTLLGATWLVLKTEGALQDWARARVIVLLSAVLVFLAIAFVYALFSEFAVMDRWLERPVLFAFPAVGLLALAMVIRGVRTGSDLMPFAGTSLIFMAAFGVMAVTFWPHMVPAIDPTQSITVANAAAPIKSLEFIFWGAGIVVLPVVLIYTVVVYWLFRGKVSPDTTYH